jgi:peroxiredoxin
MNISKTFILKGLSVVALFLYLSTSQAAGLTDFDGNAKTLDDYTGKNKWTVVMVWVSWCKVSNKVVHEYVDFDTLSDDYNATVMGISMDGMDKKADALGFIEKHEIEFPNLIDDYDDVADLFNRLTGTEWKGTPAFLVYSPTGKLVLAEQGGVPAKAIMEFIQQQNKSQ